MRWCAPSSLRPPTTLASCPCVQLVRSLNPKPLWPDDEEVLPANYEPPREWFMFAPSWMVSM